jgi:hypothetical protein
MPHFIEKLQTSEEHIKLRWLIGSSAVAIVLVVMLWLTYFNTLVQTNPGQNDQPAQDIGFWPTFKGGLGVVYYGIGGKIGGWFHELKAPSTYEVK